MRRWLRVLSIPLLLGIALIACGVIVFVFARGSGNPNLNPVEAAYLRVWLGTKEQALRTPISRDALPICFVVNQGDNANAISTALVQQGFVKEADLFRNYVRYYGIDAKLQAGTFSLRKSLTIPEIAQALTNVGANTITFRVIEGWRIEEIMQYIDSFNPPLAFKGTDFYNLVSPGAATRSELARALSTRVSLPDGRSLEGFLFPDTYTLPACAKADRLLQSIIENFIIRFTDQMIAEARAQNLTPFQVVTLASIVEREAVVADERPMIASVYLNRLRQPMKLDADPTIQYALGNRRDPSTWWPRITAEDYRGVNDPYNTYLFEGLPPGPIANPGLSSIQAVLRPETSPYFFFRASCAGDGRHQFATTFEEHLANGC